MADHSKPLVTSTYTNFVTELDGRFDDLALGLDPATTTPTNLPTGAIRWNSASSKWEKWSGTAWADLSASYNINLSGPLTLTANSSSDALRITQTGAGNCLVVEDSANPDSTPFVINAGGTVIAGNASAIGVAGGSPQIQNHSTGASGSLVSTTRWAAGSGAGGFSMAHSRGATIGAYDSLISGDAFGSLSFQGADGTGFIEGASINAYVDGTPGTNDMPGRLVFATRAAGDPSPTEAMRIRSDGNIGIGNSGADYQKLGVNGNYPFDSGGTTEVVSVRGTFVSGTTGASAFKSRPITATATFNIPSLAHFDAHPNTFGAGSTVTTQYGFIAQNTLTGATNNYGFYSNIASGTGRWNFYAAGTADNYFAGNVGIGIEPSSKLEVAASNSGITNPLLANNRLRFTDYDTTTAVDQPLGVIEFYSADPSVVAGVKAYIGATSTGTAASTALVFATDYTSGTPIERMRIRPEGCIAIGGVGSSNVSLYNQANITGGSSSYANYTVSTIQSDVTVSGVGNRSVLGTAASAFALADIIHYWSSQGTIGAGSAVTNQRGFYVDSTLTGATNNYGFYSNIASGTGRYNFYAAGTADNYFAGNTYFGSTSVGIAISTYDVTFKRSGANCYINHSDAAGIMFRTNTGTSAVNRLYISHADSLVSVQNSGLQISQTAVTAPAATDGNVFSGTYTPTLTNTTNVSSSTAYITSYCRVGNTVIISGQVSVGVTATGSFTLGISLPIPSGFTLTYDATGTANSSNATHIGVIRSNSTTDIIEMVANATSTVSTFVSFSATYRVK